VFDDCVGSVHGHLVISGIAMLNSQVVVLQGDIQVGVDETLFDELPNNASHFIAV